jgi:thymidylate synthase (FAD)
VNHQGSEGTIELKDNLDDKVSQQLSQSFDVYEELLENGCCREQARGTLPQSTYTEFYWKINLHNLLHYLHLRMDAHAQQEIREYATAIFNLVKPLVPITMEAFMDFRVNALQLTGPEIEAIANGTEIQSPGERREFLDKLKRLKLNIPS